MYQHKVIFLGVSLFWLLALGGWDGHCLADNQAPEEAVAGDLDNEGQENIGVISQGLTNVKVKQYCYGSGYHEAVCEVYCPSGYLATGGGCKADDVEWKLRESRPTSQGEGWRCTAREDWGSRIYNKSVTGYVVCFQQ